MNSFRRSDGGEGIQRVDVIIRNVSLCAFLPRAHGDCRVSVVRVWEMHCGFTKAVHIRHQPRAQFTESCRLRWVLNPTRPRINITDQGGDRVGLSRQLASTDSIVPPIYTRDPDQQCSVECPNTQKEQGFSCFSHDKRP